MIQIKKYILKNIASGVTRTILSMSLTLIAIPIIITNIGLEKYGLITIVTIFSGLTGLMDLGLSKSLVLFYGKNKINEVSSIYIINSIIFITVFLLALIFFFLDYSLIPIVDNTSKNILIYLNFVCLITLSLSIINNMLRASLEAIFELTIVNWGFLIQSIITYGGWLLLSFFKLSIVYYFIVPLIGTVFTIIFHIYFLKVFLNNLKIPDKSSYKNVFRLTINFFKVGVLNSIHLPLINFIIIYYTKDTKALAIFELSNKLSLTVNNFLAYISTPFFGIASNIKDKNHTSLLLKVKRTTLYIIGVVVVGYFFFLLINTQIIRYFFKSDDLRIFEVLNICLLGCLFIASSETIQKFSLGVGKITMVFRIKLLGLFLNIVLCLVFLKLVNESLLAISYAYGISLIFIGLYWISIIFRKSSLKKYS